MADFEALPAGSRRAMQLALEALEQCGLDDSQRRYHLEAEAKTTLRAMLGMASRPEAPMADHDHGRLMANLRDRRADLAAIGRRVLTALDHGWIEAPDQVADDLRSVLTPPADGRQEPSIATEEVRSCMTCAHILKGALEEPCARCSNGSHWERHASASGSALSRWVGEHRAAGST
jgi:hypothetical protein